MSKTGKWGYTTDGIIYTGIFDSAEEAAAEYGSPGETVDVGRYRDPVPPEEYLDADLVIEHVLVQDEYEGEWAEGTLEASDKQLDELTADLRRVFAAWIDRHDLRPIFVIVDKAIQIEVAQAKGGE